VLPYTDLADKVLGILTVKEIEPEQVSDVLRMSYEQNLTNRDIARRLELRNHHTVGKILDASAQVLREQPLAKVS
jgi:DNA-binding transcriptional regulator LsrR (DeoR family)